MCGGGRRYILLRSAPLQRPWATLFVKEGGLFLLMSRLIKGRVGKFEATPPSPLQGTTEHVIRYKAPYSVEEPSLSLLDVIQKMDADYILVLFDEKDIDPWTNGGLPRWTMMSRLEYTEMGDRHPPGRVFTPEEIGMSQGDFSEYLRNEYRYACIRVLEEDREVYREDYWQERAAHYLSEMKRIRQSLAAGLQAAVAAAPSST